MFNKEQFYKDLETIVNIDSGSYDPEGTTQVAKWFSKRFEALGWHANWHDPQPGKRGKSVFLAPPRTDEMDLFITCHVDTVFPKGEVSRRPFSKDEKRLYGPGVGDMKAGCLFTLMALEELIAEKSLLGKIGVFFNTEEEISSVNTRPIIEAYAKKAKRSSPQSLHGQMEQMSNKEKALYVM